MRVRGLFVNLIRMNSCKWAGAARGINVLWFGFVLHKATIYAPLLSIVLPGDHGLLLRQHTTGLFV